MASHLRSVIHIRTRAGKAKADHFRPARCRATPTGERAYEGARPPVLGSDMVRIRRESGHVSHVGVGILIRPLARECACRPKVNARIG